MMSIYLMFRTGRHRLARTTRHRTLFSCEYPRKYCSARHTALSLRFWTTMCGTRGSRTRTRRMSLWSSRRSYRQLWTRHRCGTHMRGSWTTGERRRTSASGQRCCRRCGSESTGRRAAGARTRVASSTSSWARRRKRRACSRGSTAGFEYTSRRRQGVSTTRGTSPTTVVCLLTPRVCLLSSSRLTTSTGRHRGSPWVRASWAYPRNSKLPCTRWSFSGVMRATAISRSLQPRSASTTLSSSRSTGGRTPTRRSAHRTLSCHEGVCIIQVDLRSCSRFCVSTEGAMASFFLARRSVLDTRMIFVAPLTRALAGAAAVCVSVAASPGACNAAQHTSLEDVSYDFASKSTWLRCGSAGEHVLKRTSVARWHGGLAMLYGWPPYESRAARCIRSAAHALGKRSVGRWFGLPTAPRHIPASPAGRTLLARHDPPPTSTPRATVRERCHMVIISRSWSTWLLRYLGTSLPYRECTARRPTRGSSISADPLSRLPDTLSAPLASDPIGDRYAGPIPNSYPPPHSLPFHKAPPSRLKDPCGPVAD